MDALWADLECEGHDLAITVGQIATDPREHAFSKVPGRVDFCLDVRSASVQTLDSLRVHLAEIVAGIETERQVHFELGEITGSTPALMAPGLIRIAEAAAADLGVPVWHMASGAGHDAAVFAAAGVPAAMLFIRNENGSHNPHEHMGMEDFGAACRVLLEMVRRFPN